MAYQHPNDRLKKENAVVAPVLEQILKQMDRVTNFDVIDINHITIIMHMRDELLLIAKTYGATDKRWK